MKNWLKVYKTIIFLFIFVFVTESEQPGEIALMEFKHSRSEQQRLREIDQRLKYLEVHDDENVSILAKSSLSLTSFGLDELLF